MNRVEKQLEKMKAQQRVGLMTHVVVGYPNIETTRELVLMMVEEGVDMIELQIPFSDPLGDGPTIRVANTRSIENGTKTKDAFDLVRQLREEDGVEIPLLFMTYFNIVHHYGVEQFCKDAKEVGIDGLIVPDYPLNAEPHEHLEQFATNSDLMNTRFLSLDSSTERVASIADGAKGFFYCFAQRGVTGSRSDMEQELQQHLAGVRETVDLPLAVGFGISKGEHVATLKGYADMAIAGSSIIKAYEDGGAEGARELVRELVQGGK